MIISIAAVRVAERGYHMIFGQQVEVQLVESEPATGEQLHPVTSTDNILLVKGLNPQYHTEATLDLYFSNQATCSGGDIVEIILKGTEAYITYAEPGGTAVAVPFVYSYKVFSPVVAARVAEKSQHIVLGHTVEVQLVVSKAATDQQPDTITSVTNTLLVKGLNPECHSQSMLDLYFSSQTKCCRGGDIAEIIVKDNEAYITYAESGGSYNTVFDYLIFNF